MKIGILTQPLHTNYGGLLQNYALQQILIRLGHYPITLDQKCKSYPKWYIFLGRIKGWIVYLCKRQNNKPRYTLNEEEDRIIRKHTIAFIDKYIRHSKKCAGSDDFKTVAKTLGIESYVVGSDQCWRPCYNMYLKDMFLDFCKDMDVKKRVAYAASFGSNMWEFTTAQTAVCSELAQYFDTITVREYSGVKFCKQYLGVNAVQVVDPTLLLTKEDYTALINENNLPKSEGNLFNYILDPTPAKSMFIQNLTDATDFKPFQVLPKYNEDHRTKSNVKLHIADCVYPSPIAWLRAFMDADMTIVDSFHGAVFSIIFNKPFWVLANKERGLARFVSLLSIFELEDRLLCPEDISIIDYCKPIDWDKVNMILNKKREESYIILKDSLE